MFSTDVRSLSDISMTDTQNGVRLEWELDSAGLTTTVGALLMDVNISQITEDSFLFQ
jgi:hypothetical protein